MCPPCEPCGNKMAVEKIYPNATAFGGSWIVHPSGQHHEVVDEGCDSPNTSDYVYDVDPSEDMHLNFTDPQDEIGAITEITVLCHAKYVKGFQASNFRINVNVEIDGNYHNLGNIYPGSTYSTKSVSVSGLSYTKTQANTIRVLYGAHWMNGFPPPSMIRMAATHVELTYTPSFTKTHEDWFEYVENPMKTFIERMQSEIVGDSNIDVYYSGVGKVPVIRTGDITRHDINALCEKHIIFLHNPRWEDVESAGGNGRDDRLFYINLGVGVKSSKGYDPSTAREVMLYGDGTSTRPGLFEIFDDLDALFFPATPGSVKNMLASGGVNYLWDLEAGTVAIDDGGEKSELVFGVRPMVGHKWRINW